MKTAIPSLLIAWFCVVASLALGGGFKTEIITSTPLTIDVPDAHFLQIHKFTQEGGGQRGVVSVTTDAGTANVLTASIIDSGAPEFSRKITIAGPASVTVAPVSGATLFITYRKMTEATPTPTPTPTATPTPTVTATATPTP
jgi:hypothetical protein